MWVLLINIGVNIGINFLKKKRGNYYEIEQLSKKMYINMYLSESIVSIMSTSMPRN